MTSPTDELTLRDHIAAAVRLNRELTERVEQSLVPKVHALRKMTRAERAADDPAPGDKSVHATAAEVLAADHSLAMLYDRLAGHCTAVRDSLRDETA